MYAFASPLTTGHGPVRLGLSTPVCRCGQDLDIVRGHHCPRCGVTLGEGLLVRAA
jgi:hypothetical protein